MRVLFSTRHHAMDRNPYLRQLEMHLSDQDVSVRPWAWRTALLGRYDVLHVHWPEYIVTHRRPHIAAVNAVLSYLLLVRLQLVGTPVVWTVHNEQPHFTVNRGARRRLRWLNRLVVERIQLHDAPPAENQTLILHGDYQDWYAQYPQYSPRSGRILFFGLIRAYKNVPALIAAFASLPGADLTLRVVGEPDDDSLRDELVRSAARDDRVHLILGFASEADLAAEISSASLVVLPYSHVFNSGAALLALSLGRPILVASSDSMQSLGHEVGDGWVLTYDGALAPDQLTSALAIAESRPDERPRLDDRSWTHGASLHKQVYRHALGPTSAA